MTVAAALGPAALDALMPMALIFDRGDGRIRHVGPRLRKIAPDLSGRTVGAALELKSPSGPATADILMAHAGRRLSLRLRGEAGEAGRRATRMRAVALPLEGGDALLDLSFGPDVAEAVRRHRLDVHDFGPTDPTVELLFLVEARDAVLGELTRLSDRLAEARDAAELRAKTDGLTGLPNRRALEHVLKRLAGDPAARFGVMHLDLDHFKQVNDTLGHAAGDLVLERVAAILTDEVRIGDLVARVGGDEFILVFPDCVDVGIMVQIGERIIERLQRPIAYGTETCRISGSAGITLSSFYGELDMDVLLEDADKALYRSKEAGRSQVRVAEPSGQTPRRERRAKSKGAKT